jgi:hypothetical protein
MIQPMNICVGNLYHGYRVPLVTAKTSLDTTQFPLAVNDMGTKYPVLDMVIPLLA